MKRALAAAAVLALTVTGCGGKQQADPPAQGGGQSCEAGEGRITIATGNSGGVYYVLSRIYPNSTQVLVRTDSGINSVADMKGKRISTGSPKSGTEVIANRLLQAAGLKPDTDVQAQRLDLAKTADGMKSGTLDGLVWSGGLPTAQITDITTALKDKVKFLDITPLLPKLKQVNDVYDQGVIPAAAYGQPADVPTVVVPNLLLVREDFPANNACALTKLLFDKQAELAKVHPAAKEITKQLATRTEPVPLHPGAKQALG
jgi:TRAP transporter TAXI family solute receptor